MLPRPTLSFTLPSIHDDTTLACRIYHPECLDTPTRDWQWARHAAIVAHPYAPMGGCYDDPVVSLVAKVLLRAGFLVATFNFRGTFPSGGRTSWTSGPERDDYATVAAFTAYYAHYLSPSPSHRQPTDTPQTRPSPTLLFAGYSYGAMVTTKLASLDELLLPFAAPLIHTAAADVRLRAQHLAEQQNKLFNASPTSPQRSMGVRVGGDEHTDRSASPPSTKTQHSRQRSRSNSYEREERIRDGVRHILERTKLIHPKPDDSSADESGIRLEDRSVREEERHLDRASSFTRYHSAYLVVSPPYGIVSNLLSLPNPFGGWSTSRAETRQTSSSQRDRAGSSGGHGHLYSFLSSFMSSSKGIDQNQGDRADGNTNHPRPQSRHSSGKEDDNSSHSQPPGSNRSTRHSGEEPPSPRYSSSSQSSMEEIDHEGGDAKLASHPTLLIYGGEDGLLSQRRIQKWGHRLGSAPGSAFHSVEVSGAGHFWVEEGMGHKLRDAIRLFAQGLVEGKFS